MRFRSPQQLHFSSSRRSSSSPALELDSGQKQTVDALPPPLGGSHRSEIKARSSGSRLFAAANPSAGGSILKEKSDRIYRIVSIGSGRNRANPVKDFRLNVFLLGEVGRSGAVKSPISLRPCGRSRPRPPRGPRAPMA